MANKATIGQILVWEAVKNGFCDEPKTFVSNEDFEIHINFQIGGRNWASQCEDRFKLEKGSLFFLSVF